MAGNPSDGFRESSLLPRKRGRPKSNTGPIVCENASSNSSGTGSSAPRQLGQDENHITDTNEFCEETMSDTTLRKRGRPLGCTDPGHNQMCGVRGDENSLKYGIQDQMNLGVGTNRPVHQPRIPLIDITKNVASANWNSEAGRNPSPDSSRVEDDPLSGSNSQIVEVKKRGRPKKNHDIPVPSTNWTPGSGGNPSPHNERVVDDPLSGVTNIGSNSKIVEMKGRGRPRKNKAMPDAGAKLAWTSAHPGDLSAGGGLMGAGTFLTPEAGGNPSPNNHSVEDDPRSGVTNIGSNSKIVEMKRRGRPKKNRDMPGEPVTNRFCDDSDRPVIPHQMNQLLGTNRLNYAPRIPLNDITHDGNGLIS